MYAQQGIPDLIGCLDGYFFGLEVKVPGKEDTLTPLQNETINTINIEGGHAAMVTSTEQAVAFVQRALIKAGSPLIPKGEA